MRRTITRASACAAGAGLFAWLLLPAATQAYTFLGGTLDLSQRDFRVCNNFTDPEANDNQASDPNFPGALGAPLAIWKAVVEWGSERHGSGYGDPMQPSTLGSGGANFDSSWQGIASSPGATDENVFSEISGQSGGVLAFTETPIQDGWRIRFYQDAAVWFDGPEAPPPGTDHIDLQGVAAHEYGHALGLGHSTDANATMFNAPVGTVASFRTIELDDIAGVQALYGPRSASKPHVESYHVTGTALRIQGSGFTAAGNEVWFTDAGPTSDGTPLKVVALPSSANGTTIDLVVPAFAAPGDFLVKVPGNDGASLSNAFPFDPAQSSCPPPVIYGTAKLTSQGTLPNLFVFGQASASTHDLEVGTSGGIPNVDAILFSGPAQASIPFQGGTLLVAGPHQRHGVFPFDFFGTVQIPIAVDASMIGTRRSYQLWFQDPGDPFGVGLSDAVTFFFCP